MENQFLDRQVFEFSNQRQRRIYEKIRELVGPGPASFFKDACWMMNNPNVLESTTYFVGHCMREIESALRDVLKPIQEFADANINSADSSGEHKKEIQRILRSLEIPENDEVAKAWFELAENLHRLAHRRALEPPRSLEEVQRFWEKFQDLLDTVLTKIESKFLIYFSVLDQLLVGQPTEENIKRLRNEIPNNFVTRRYFFDRLENPELVEKLRDQGFFKKPPHPIREKGSISFPRWPEAKYLARMAKHKPELIARIILEMEDTENVAVLEDLVDAALSMPPDISAQLAEKAKKWAEVPYFFLPKKIGELMAHWAKGRKIQETINLARTLLDVLPGEREPDIEKPFSLPPKPRARFDAWLYEQILQNYYPEFVKAVGLPALELLCDLLEKAIRLSRRKKEDDDSEDFSCIWRPAIEDHPQNLGHTVKDALVSAVRDATELLVKSGQASVEEVIETLDQRKWKVFRRITLHILRLFSEQAQALIVACLTDRDLFEDVGAQHEYALLLRENFPRLPEEGKQKILEWIEEGPRQPDQPREQWQLRRLTWIGLENLPANWQKRYRELVAKYGEPEHQEFPVYFTSWIGPTSPKTEQELKAMSVEEIVEFLRNWKPPARALFGPSPEGLGRVLQEVVADDPQRFAKGAEKFKTLDPTYVRALISGLEVALKKQKNFEWSPVLKLCRWVVEQPREIPGRKAEIMEADPDWGWTRKAIAHLFLTAFDGDKGKVSFEAREEIWDILKPLTDDPDPTPKDEERYRGSTMDPATLSINTVRGTAMHAVIQYALWVRRHLEKQPDATERLSRGFDEMPEVREVLEAHLDINRDPSLAIRSVYGQWFPWLVLLDQNWAEKWKAQIFPLDAESEAYFDAAWNTYIIFCQPYDNVFQILRDVYAHAVARISQHEDRFRYLAHPDVRLAEHLMVFYWRGKVDLKDPLFVSFWEKASDSLRAHAIEFIGRSLKYTDEPIPNEIIEQLQKLWSERFSQAKRYPAKHEREVAVFGWWFVSGKFDIDWSVTMLLKALKLVPKTEPADMVIERLSEIAETYPLKSGECLRRIAEEDKEGWLLYTNEETIRKVLQFGLANPNARRRAEELINYLGSRGFHNYRDLLRV